MRTHVKLMAAGLLGAFVAAGAAVQAESTPVSANKNLTLKASAKRVNAGEVVTVDVFVQNVADLAVYQVQVDAAGGQAGTLAVESITINKDREDWVFADTSAQVIDAVDARRNRAGALVMTGSTNVDAERYLVTYTFRASDDATGTFNISVTPGEETFMLDPISNRLSSKSGEGVEVVVGQAASRKR